MSSCLRYLEAENYLVPVDSPELSGPSTAKEQCISLNSIIDMLAEARPENVPIICILDCCRTEIATRTRGVNGSMRGDFVEYQGSNSNVFIMYATAGNQAAANGKEGDNGAFTKILLKYMDADMTIESVAKKVLGDLGKELKGAQVCNATFLD